MGIMIARAARPFVDMTQFLAVDRLKLRVAAAGHREMPVEPSFRRSMGRRRNGADESTRSACPPIFAIVEGLGTRSQRSTRRSASCTRSMAGRYSRGSSSGAA